MPKGGGEDISTKVLDEHEDFYRLKFFLGILKVDLDSQIGPVVFFPHDWTRLQPLGRIFHQDISSMVIAGTVAQAVSDLRFPQLAHPTSLLMQQLQNTLLDRQMDTMTTAESIVAVLAGIELVLQDSSQCLYPLTVAVKTTLLEELQKALRANLALKSPNYQATCNRLGMIWCGIGIGLRDLSTLPPVTTFLASRIIGHATAFSVTVNTICAADDFSFKTDPNVLLARFKARKW